MHIKFLIILRNLFFLAAFVNVQQTGAYQLTGVSWSKPETTFYVDIPGADDLWNRTFEGAMAEWANVTSFQYKIFRGEYADPCSILDGRNGVGFEATDCGYSWGSTVLAFTYTRFIGSTLIEADINFNGTEDWSVYNGPWRASYGDFRRVAVHELGHALGLGHEDQVPAIMATYVGNTELPLLDDIQGVAVIYGSIIIDSDFDGVRDGLDNCPNLANPGQWNTDNDVLGNVCDSDDDNDGMPDTYELSNSFNPLNASDAFTDADGDGYSNLSEYKAGTDPLDYLSTPKPIFLPFLPLLLE